VGVEHCITECFDKPAKQRFANLIYGAFWLHRFNFGSFTVF
jgi:hypothetical protein